MLNTNDECVQNKCIDFSCEGLGRCIILDESPVCACGSIENIEHTICNKTACDSSVSPNCSPFGTCINEIYGKFRCKCQNEMYSGEYCERITNVCESNDCQNGGTCIKVFPAESCCLCPNGFSGFYFL